MNQINATDLAAQVAANNAAGITAPIRINDDSTRVREVNYNPAEFDVALKGTPLDGATDLQGVPLGYSKALEADASTVLVYHNGLPLRLSQALELGLCTRAQLGAQQQPAAVPSSTTTDQNEGEGAPAEPTEHETAVATLRGELFDQTDRDNLATLQSAAERSGFSLESATRDLLVDGFDREGATVKMLSQATGNTAESIVETITELNDHVVGQLVELAGPEVIEEVMQQPGWSQAALSALASGSLVPLARFVATYVESQQR